jgi:hypothetical protein
MYSIEIILKTTSITILYLGIQVVLLFPMATLI